MARFLDFLSVSLLAIILGTSAPVAQAEDEDADLPGASQRAQAGLAELRRRAENSSIVRIKPNAFEEMDKNFRSIKPEMFPSLRVNNFPSLNAITINLPPSVVAAIAQEGKFLDKIESISPDAVIYGFGSDCDDDDLVNINSAGYTPVGVLRVHGLDGNVSVQTNVTSTKQVWLIDSGIATDAAIDGDLNVVARLQCFTDPCATDSDTDNVGHGTMLAGIIGARVKGQTYPNAGGIVGVAPDIKIVSLKIFDEDVPAGFLSVALNALKYIENNATSGDIINISWGMAYDLRDSSIPSLIEQALRDAINAKNVWAVVAAGNTDVIGGSGYVQTISPARIGGYRPMNQGVGGVITVSAVRSKWKPNNTWARDKFWRYSAFGNNGTPAFAAPGVKIESYWPGDKMNQCSGTSFSAAHVSGLLEYGMPVKLSDADFDPSAIELDKIYPSKVRTDYDASLLDPVARKP